LVAYERPRRPVPPRVDFSEIPVVAGEFEDQVSAKLETGNRVPSVTARRASPWASTRTLRRSTHGASGSAGGPGYSSGGPSTSMSRASASTGSGCSWAESGDLLFRSNTSELFGNLERVAKVGYS
jgi:hypothetical protein